MSVLAEVIAFVRVIASSVSDKSSVTLYNVGGVGAMSSAAEDDEEDGETATEQANYQSLGIVARPKAPDKNGKQCDALALKRDGELVAFAYRDVRLHEKFGAPKVGEIALVHYGGGFHSMQLTDDGDTLHTIYCPYDLDVNGVPQKAMSIVIDPANECIQMVTASGLFLSLLDGATPKILQLADEETYTELKAGTFTVNALNIVMNGACVLGGTVGVPLLPGPASPPSTKIFIAP